LTLDDGPRYQSARPIGRSAVERAMSEHEASDLARLVIRRIEELIQAFLDVEDRNAFVVALIREHRRTTSGTTSRLVLQIVTHGASASDIRAQIYGSKGRMLTSLIRLAHAMPEVRESRVSIDLRLPHTDVDGRLRYMERRPACSELTLEQQRAEMSQFIRSIVCQIVDEVDVPRIRVAAAADAGSSFDLHLVSVLPGERPLQGLLIGSGGATASAIQVLAQARNNALGFERGVTVTIERNEVMPDDGATSSSRTLARHAADVVHRRRTA
jgi:predicted RNA-binding protein Jag